MVAGSTTCQEKAIETASGRKLLTQNPYQQDQQARRTPTNGGLKNLAIRKGLRKQMEQGRSGVRNTISSVTKLSSSNLQIKRKYKLSRNNPDTVTKWWFVVRDEESVLLELEREWSSVAMQTAWKLEPVHSYVEHSTPNESTELPSIVSAPIVPNSTVSSR